MKHLQRQQVAKPQDSNYGGASSSQHHSVMMTHFEMPQLLHCVWQALQPVVAEVKVLQLFKLTDALWQADQLVVGQVQPCQMVQLFQDPT